MVSLKGEDPKKRAEKGEVERGKMSTVGRMDEGERVRLAERDGSRRGNERKERALPMF